MFTIIWTPEAKDDFVQNIIYLEKDFSDSVVEDFIVKVESVIKILENDPQSFRLSDYKNIRQIPVVPQITVFYAIADNDQVLIIRLWNNYQDRNRLEL